MYSSRGHIGHGRGNRHLRLGWTVFSGAPCDIGVGYKLVDKLLAAHLADDILVIVVPQCPAELVVVHVGLVLAQPPESGHLLCIHQLEFPTIS